MITGAASGGRRCQSTMWQQGGVIGMLSGSGGGGGGGDDGIVPRHDLALSPPASVGHLLRSVDENTFGGAGLNGR